MKTFEIALKNIEYKIDVLEEDGEVEVFVECVDEDREIPDNELLTVIEYLVKEGFVRDPADGEILDFNSEQ
jgi:glycine cleavage system H lipoate-binding protein